MKKVVLCSIMVSTLLAGCSAPTESAQNTLTQNAEAEVQTQNALDTLDEKIDETQPNEEETTLPEKADAPTEEETLTETDSPAESDETDVETKANTEKSAEDEAKAKAQEAAEAQAQIDAQADAMAKAEAEAKAKAKAEAEAKAKAEAEAKAQNENAVTIISKVYIEDCGLDTGYWEVTYSDGHVEHIDD